MDSAFRLSIDWLAFMVLASNPQETMKVLGGDWSKAKEAFEAILCPGSGWMGYRGSARMRLFAPMRSMSISPAIWFLL